MFQPHARIETPSNETVVWRYVDMPKLIATLNGNLFLCRVEQLKDPWEGRMPPRTGDDSETTHEICDFNESQRDRAFVSCWHESPRESAALWDNYAGNSGFAIRSTIQRIKNAANSDETHFYIGRVRYGTIPIEKGTHDVAVPANTLAWFFEKRKSFEYEQEIRLLNYFGPIGDPPSNIQLRIDARELIDSIHVSPHAHPWIVDCVSQLLEKLGLSEISVMRSTMYDSSVY